MLQCVPSQDEGNLLQAYVRSGGKRDGLSDAELFCMDLMKVSEVTVSHRELRAHTAVEFEEWG